MTFRIGPRTRKVEGDGLTPGGTRCYAQRRTASAVSLGLVLKQTRFGSNPITNTCVFVIGVSLKVGASTARHLDAVQPPGTQRKPLLERLVLERGQRVGLIDRPLRAQSTERQRR